MQQPSLAAIACRHCPSTEPAPCRGMAVARRACRSRQLVATLLPVLPLPASIKEVPHRSKCYFRTKTYKSVAHSLAGTASPPLHCSPRILFLRPALASPRLLLLLEQTLAVGDLTPPLLRQVTQLQPGERGAVGAVGGAWQAGHMQVQGTAWVMAGRTQQQGKAGRGGAGRAGDAQGEGAVKGPLMRRARCDQRAVLEHPCSLNR